ncbi:hypothetical protein K439DRAFT_1610687 [Ramaria rubella]|nr:hypothetical protein K439DRAFT_1610687 [Ramaria rubella]
MELASLGIKPKRFAIKLTNSGNHSLKQAKPLTSGEMPHSKQICTSAMYQAFPDLCPCKNHWKVKLIASEKYQSWSKLYREAGKLLPLKSVAKLGADEDSMSNAVVSGSALIFPLTPMSALNPPLSNMPAKPEVIDAPLMTAVNPTPSEKSHTNSPIATTTSSPFPDLAHILPPPNSIPEDEATTTAHSYPTCSLVNSTRAITMSESPFLNYLFAYKVFYMQTQTRMPIHPESRVAFPIMLTSEPDQISGSQVVALSPPTAQLDIVLFPMPDNPFMPLLSALAPLGLHTLYEIHLLFEYRNLFRIDYLKTHMNATKKHVREVFAGLLAAMHKVLVLFLPTDILTHYLKNT